MKKIASMIIRMILGFLFCALGTVMALNSKLGLSPWDVFHQGLTNIIGITIGQASILVGVVVVVIASILGIKVGLGTIANMIIIGCFIDLIIYAKLIPVCNNLIAGILMMLGSLIVNAIGSYLYIGCGMGCGPRDGLMIALVKITGKPISLIRFCIEMGALSIGWLLGGFVGVGSFITAFAVGYCVQIVYRIFNFDVKSLSHRNIKQGVIYINQCLVNQNN
ncbi:YczE/YyaS/YitT family protein [Clostridium sp. 'White wine YQ']|uniref:YczE/YyaS/YitT family protein n=1 Tax=Clostridium sp. 'White wine YQ' TaxID=3027474 RepID=UPI0023652357|nr:hypothetical protein [Clostridium sp. 'White wine YQ']MDD7795387.1 hypothetical protein [Clostridium sp. 'White wine YQ']